jgi:predicted enzyme related to lactoylglutathione lyase
MHGSVSPWIARAALPAFVWFGYACGAAPGHPPVTTEPTNTVITGKFVWHDLLTSDPDAAQRFYGDLMGWDFQPGDNGDRQFIIAHHDGEPIAGILDTRGGGAERMPAQWIASLSVPDVEAAAERVRDRGGRVLWGPRGLGRRGPVALVVDPQRAAFALMRVPGGDPPDATPAHNEWLWDELWTPHPDSAVTFYQQLAGYLANELRDGDRIYYVLEAHRSPRAGVAHLQRTDIRPNWLPYLRVSDVRATVTRAESLGGRVLIRPSPEIRGGRVALIQDPTGAAVALQEWEPKKP